MVRGREAWHAAVRGATSSWTQISDRTTNGHFVFDKRGKTINGEKIASLISGAISCPGKTGHLHVKERH